jgi:hypothetical protein
MRKNDPLDPHDELPPEKVVFEPTDPDTNDVFEGSVLPRHRVHSSNEKDIAFAGIPLDPNELRKRERCHRKVYDQVDMEFETEEGLL